jgi:hypothetical protein
LNFILIFSSGILSLCFTSNGEALYLQSSSELQRLTVAANHAVEARCGVELPEGSRPPKKAPVVEEQEAEKKESKANEAAPGAAAEQKTPTSEKQGNGDVSSHKESMHEESKLETSQMSTDITIDSIKDHLG